MEHVERGTVEPPERRWLGEAVFNNLGPIPSPSRPFSTTFAYIRGRVGGMCDVTSIFPRTDVRRVVDLSCAIVTSRYDVPLVYRATDMSTSGLWATTSKPLRLGEVVVACFQPRDWSRELQVFAEVVRVDEGPEMGMGLSFLDLTTDERFRLSMWLRGRREAGRRGAVEVGVEGPTAWALRAALAV